MGYPVKTLNLNIKAMQFRSDGFCLVKAVEHDFRQYKNNAKTLPAHIDEARVGNNLVYLSREVAEPLNIANENLFKEVSEVLSNIDNTFTVFSEINEQEKSKRFYVDQKYPQYISSSPLFCGVLFNFSKLAQETLVTDFSPHILFQKIKTFSIDFLELIMGTRVLYLILHNDESAPHVHGIITNQRYYEKLSPQPKHYKEIIDNSFYNYLLNNYFLTDLKDKLAKGFLRTFTGTFTTDKELAEKSYYRLPFSFLQDITHYAFKDIGFERGKPMAERLKEGEPLWKLISRDVKTLHQDLPREIALKEKELQEKTKQVEYLNELLVNMQGEIDKTKQFIEQEKQKLNLEVELEKRRIEDLIQAEKTKALRIQNIVDKLKQKKERYTSQIIRLEQINKPICSDDELAIYQSVLKLLELDNYYEINKFLQTLKQNKLFAIVLEINNYLQSIMQHAHILDDMAVSTLKHTLQGNIQRHLKQDIVNYIKEIQAIQAQDEDDKDDNITVDEPFIKEDDYMDIDSDIDLDEEKTKPSF